MNRGGTALVLIALGVIASIALAFSILGFAAAQASDQNPYQKPQNLTTLAVSGYGEVSYTPDKAVVSFVALGYGGTASEALEKCSAKASAIISAIEALGVKRESMKTSSITVRPRYDWEAKPPRIVDYEASYILSVELSDITLVGKAIDAAFSAGADSMYNLQFLLSNGEKEKLTREAIQQAIEEAMGKAEAAASTLGLKVLRVESISISPQYVPSPIVVRELAAAGKQGEVPIAPGEGRITASVSLTIILG